MKTEINTTVTVDRSVDPKANEWLLTYWDPELQKSGPEIYDLSEDIKFLRKPGGEFQTGLQIYTELKKLDLLKKCLNLQDCQAIKELGPEVFIEVFGEVTLYFFGSAIHTVQYCPLIPTLCVGIEESDIRDVYCVATDLMKDRDKVLMFKP